jgi:hypothetical protein
MAEMMVRRVGILSVAKIEGLLMFVVGLFIGVIYGLIFIIFGAAIMASMAQRSGGDQALGGVGPIVGGIIMMIAIPIFYGIMGFIGGAIGAVIYNIAAGIVGGIKLELEATAQYAAPPTPQQWSGNPYPAN